MTDYVPPGRRLYLTPNSPPSADYFCFQLNIPDDPYWVGLVSGALSTLTEAASWRQYGTLTPDEAANAYLDIMFEAWDNPGCAGASQTPTPFWDDGSSVDDEADPTEQPWYGYVNDPDAPANQLTFFEDATIWVFTGLLAVSASPAAAILYRSIAPSFVIAMRSTDVVEIVRILINGQDAAIASTSGVPGEILEIPLSPGDPDPDHEILIVRQT